MSWSATTYCGTNNCHRISAAEMSSPSNYVCICDDEAAGSIDDGNDGHDNDDDNNDDDNLTEPSKYDDGTWI